MKNYLKFLVVFMLVFTFALGLASCQFGGGDTDEPPVVPPIVDDPVEDYRIRFVYSFTALETNSNGREDFVDKTETVHQIYVPENNPTLSDEQKAEIAGLSYHGYSFVSWHYSWDKDTQTPAPNSEIDFDDFDEIDGDITIYGYRGDLAGADINWKVEFFDKNGASVAPELVADSSSKVDVKEGTLTVTGTGAMFDFANADNTDLPWYKYYNFITKIVIGEGITSVGNNAFFGLSKVKEVVFPESLERIGSSSFANCSGKAWRYLSLPSNLKTIGESAFANTSFKEVVLNDGLETIGAHAFNGANTMRTIVVPTSLKSIELAAFHPGSSGGTSNTHALSKVYYKGTREQFDQINIALDNIWFVDLPTIYIYTEDEAVGNTGAYWHYAENSAGEVTANPVQYCYTINYLLPSGKVPFDSQYIPVSPVMDANGDIVTDDDGIAKLEGIITEAIINARESLTYHNMKFVGFKAQGSAPAFLSVGDKITADLSYTAERGNILSDGGGIIWSYDSGSGTLTISKNPNADEGASFEMWDFVDAMDTGVLWTGSFSSISNVKKVIIGDGVEHIGDLAFANLTGISEIVLPESVKSIGPKSFAGCGALLSIYYMGSDAKAVAGLLNEDGTLALLDTQPAVFSKVETAVATPGSYWMYVKDADNKEKRLAWSITATETEGVYSNGILTIGGDSVMIDFEHPELTPWYAARSYITSVAFASNITNLGENVINGFDKVVNLTFPGSLRVIPASALEGTGVVNNREAYVNGMLVINGILVKVDASKLNKELIETYIGVTIIAGGAFDNITNLQRIYIASSVQYINAGAFKFAIPATVYFDGSEDGWKGIAADSGLIGNTNVLYKATAENTGSGYWDKVGNEYVVAGCNHIFGEWTVTKPADCTNTGIETRYCIYNHDHFEDRVIETTDVHKYEGDEGWVVYAEATCFHGTIYRRTCVLESIYHVCGGFEEKEDETTILEHNIPADYIYNNDATCTVDGTMSKICSNDGCDYADTILDPAHPKTGHSYTTYVYNEDGTCLVDGTKTALCDNGCGETKTVVDDEHISIGWHTFVDYIPDGDATCLADGHETAICTVCGESDNRIDVDSHLTQPCSYTKKDMTASFFAGYTEDKTAATYFYACEWCGVKGPFTYEEKLIKVDGVDTDALPAGVTVSGFTAGGVAPTTGKWAVVLSEEIESVVNYYLNVAKQDDSGTHNLTFQTSDTGDSYVYEFSFRWNYANSLRSDNCPIIIKISAGGATASYQPTVADDGKTLKYGTAKLNAENGWQTIRYEFNKNSAGDGYKMDVIIDGAVAATQNIAGTAAPKMIWETRWGNNEGNSNQSFDIDNVALYAAPTYELTNTVCAEGEHTLGEWFYLGDKTCEADGHKSAVCLNEGCNYVETIVDDANLKGHIWSEYTADEILDCTKAGTLTRVCLADGCDASETIEDETRPAQFAAHAWSEYTYDNNVSCTDNGTNTAYCTNPGCTVTDSVDNPDYPAYGHKFGEFVYDDRETCFDKGTKTHTCTNEGCGFSETLDDENRPAQTEHKLSAYIYNHDATCSVDGTETAKCENPDCAYTDTRPSEGHKATGHYYKDYVYNNDQTCTINGTMTAPCIYGCDGEFKTHTKDDPDHLATGHTFTNYVSDNNVTCTANGTVTATCDNGCGTIDTKVDEANLAFGHKFENYAPNNDANCTDIGTKTALCENGCGTTDTLPDETQAALGHSFTEYYYNGDRDCITNGTETSYCDRDTCEATDTRNKAGYEALGHMIKPEDYEVVENSATCQHGTLTSAPCSRDNCDYIDSKANDDVLDYHSYKQIADAKFFAGYSEDLKIAKYFESCEWCGLKAAKTFEVALEEGAATDLTNEVCADGAHTYGEHIYNNDGDCATDGTKSAVCQNGTCNHIDTVNDEEHTATGEHTWSEWVYNNDRACEVVGTSTRTCSVCQKTENRDETETYPALEHVEGEYVVVPDSVTCEQGTISKTTCTNGCGKEFIKYADDALGHNYIEKVCDEALISYATVFAPATYAKICTNCNGLNDETYTVGEKISGYEFDEDKLPAGLTTGGWSDGGSIPDSGLWARVTSEQVEEVTNFYLNVGKIHSSNTHNLKFFASEADQIKYSYSFAIRWNSAEDLRTDNVPVIVKFSGVTASAHQPKWVDGAWNYGSAVLTAGQWYAFSYDFVLNADGTGYDATVKVDGKVAMSFAATGKAIPTVAWETRYGGGTNPWSDLSFDLDKISIISVHDHKASEVAQIQFLKTAATATTPNVYYKSCAGCGEVYDETFEYGTPETYEQGKAPTAPAGVQLPSKNLLDAAPETDANNNGVADGIYITAKTETLVNVKSENVINTFLSFVDDYNTGSTAFKYTMPNYTTPYKTVEFSFDFRYQGSSDSRDADHGMIIDKGLGSTTFKENAAGDTFTINGKELTKGVWYRIAYQYTYNATKAKYDVQMFIDGELVKSGETAASGGLFFHWEPRWGSLRDTDGDGTNDAGYSNLYFDLDNINVSNTHDCAPSEVVDDAFLAEAATELSGAKYYHSCKVCGTKYDTTFVHGDPVAPSIPEGGVEE